MKDCSCVKETLLSKDDLCLEYNIISGVNRVAPVLIWELIESQESSKLSLKLLFEQVNKLSWVSGQYYS